MMQATEPVLADRAEAAAEGLVLIRGDHRKVVPWGKCSKKLAMATPFERSQLELSPGGYGIHWPLLDEDLSISGLLSSRE